MTPAQVEAVIAKMQAAAEARKSPNSYSSSGHGLLEAARMLAEALAESKATPAPRGEPGFCQVCCKDRDEVDGGLCPSCRKFLHLEREPAEESKATDGEAWAVCEARAEAIALRMLPGENMYGTARQERGAIVYAILEYEHESRRPERKTPPG